MAIDNLSIVDELVHAGVSVGHAKNIEEAILKIVGLLIDPGTGQAAEVISISSALAEEGFTLAHRVRLSSSGGNTFPYSIDSSTAIADVDYSSTLSFNNGVTASGTNIVVPSGVIEFDIFIDTVENTEDAPNKVYYLTVGDATGTGTIVDNDLPLPTNIAGITDATQVEGGTLVHTVSLTGNSGGTFVFSISSLTAVPGVDYSPTPQVPGWVIINGNQLTVPPGITSFTFSVISIDDTIVAASHTYQLTIGGASAIGTITNDDLQQPVVLSVSNASATEGQSIVHTVTLDLSLGGTFDISITNGSAVSGVDFSATPVFSNGVAYYGNSIVVPPGVLSFTASVQTVQNSAFAANKNYVLTIGGQNGVGTIVEDDSPPIPLSALTKIAIYEVPYAHLSAPQKTAIAANGGYVAFAVSRDSATQNTFRVYSSSTENGTYAQVLTGQSFTPSADLIGSIGYQHDTLAFNNEVNWPTTIAANSIGLMQDTAGQQEFSLLDSWGTYTIGGETAKVLEGIRSAIYHSLPIQVESYDTARMFILPASPSMDPTLHAQNATVYYKVVPVDAQGNELALSSVLPIPVTIRGVANKPYPPRNVGFFAGDNPPSMVADYLTFPTVQLTRWDTYIYCGNSSRLDETTPSGFFEPAATKETGVEYRVDVIGRDSQVLRTLTANVSGVAEYHISQRAADREMDPTTFVTYSIKDGVRSAELTNVVSLIHRDTPDLTSVVAAQNGTSVDVTITMERAYADPYVLTFELTGTLVTNGHVGAITASNGVLFEDPRVLQIPAGVSTFVLSIASANAATGEALTVTFGRPEFNNVLTTTTTLTLGPAYLDILLTPNQTGLPNTQIAIDTGAPRYPTNSNLSNYTNGGSGGTDTKELNVAMPANADYFVLELTNLVTSLNIGETFTLKFKDKISVPVTDGYFFQVIMTTGDGNPFYVFSLTGNPAGTLGNEYGTERGWTATNNSGVDFVPGTHKLFVQVQPQPTQRATAHTFSIRDIYKV